MKNIFKILVLGGFLFLFSAAQAQIKTPAASQGAKLETTVGLTSITLDYSRPSKSGRKIYGELVPFDAMWRTGANKNSMITFSDDVMIGGTTGKNWSYSNYNKVGIVSWVVSF